MPDSLTTAQVAAMLGVGPTTVKRWAQQGLLPVVRTPGRHRRFRRRDIDTFLKKFNGASETNGLDRWIALFLSDGRALEFKQALLAARAERDSWHDVADLIGRVLDEVGNRWSSGRIGIVQEHLIAERIGRGLCHCASLISVPARAPRCLLATAEGDDHTLGLSLAEVCLNERGWYTRWLGRFSPVESLIDQVRSGEVALVALSASEHSGDRNRLAQQLKRLLPICRTANVRLLLGGKGAWPERVDHAERVRTWSELPDALDRIQLVLGERGPREPCRPK